MDDPGLVLRCQRGDLGAYEELVNRHSKKAVRVVYLITGRQDVAEDAVQEAFLQCLRYITKLRKPESFSSWFYRILIRTARRMAAKSPVCIDMDSLDEQQKSLVMQSPDDVLDQKEARAVLRDAVSRLSKPLREAIVLRYFNDLQIQEIAEVLACPVGTVKSRLFKARLLLAAELKRRGWALVSGEGIPRSWEDGSSEHDAGTI